MTNKLLKTGLSLILVFFVQSSYSDDLIPAEFLLVMAIITVCKCHQMENI